MNITPIKVAALVFAVLLAIGLFIGYNKGAKATINRAQITIPSFFYKKSNQIKKSNNNHSRPTIYKKVHKKKAVKRSQSPSQPRYPHKYGTLWPTYKDATTGKKIFIRKQDMPTPIVFVPGMINQRFHTQYFQKVIPEGYSYVRTGPIPKYCEPGKHYVVVYIKPIIMRPINIMPMVPNGFNNNIPDNQGNMDTRGNSSPIYDDNSPLL